MKKLLTAVVLCVVTTAMPILSANADSKKADEAKIRALEGRFAAAFNAKDIKGIMAGYVPNETLFVFDVVPPRQYVGAKAYRKDWEDFLGNLKGPVSSTSAL